MYEHFGFELVTKVLIIREFLQMIASKHALTPDLARLSAGTVSTTLRLGKGIDAERASCLPSFR
jgi:hypothetical protein